MTDYNMAAFAWSSQPTAAAESYFAALNALRAGQADAKTGEKPAAGGEDTSKAAEKAAEAVDFSELLLGSFTRQAGGAAARSRTSAADFARYGTDGGAADTARLSDKPVVENARERRDTGRDTARPAAADYDRGTDSAPVAARDRGAPKKYVARDAGIDGGAERSADRFSSADTDATDATDAAAQVSAQQGAEQDTRAAGDGLTAAERDTDHQAAIAKMIATGGFEGGGETLLAYLETFGGTAEQSGEASQALGGTAAFDAAAVELGGQSGQVLTAEQKATVEALVNTVAGAVSATDGTDAGAVSAAGGDRTVATVRALLEKIGEYQDIPTVAVDDRNALRQLTEQLLAGARGAGTAGVRESTETAVTVAAGTANGEVSEAGLEATGALGAKAAKAEDTGTGTVIENQTGAGRGAVTAAQAAGAGQDAAGRQAAGQGGLPFGHGQNAANSAGGAANKTVTAADTAGAAALKQTAQEPVTAGTAQRYNAELTDTGGQAQTAKAAAGGLSKSAAGGTSRAAAGPEPALKPEFFNTLSHEAKLVLNGERSELVMQLKPESLGKVTMRVATEQGVVNAKFIVENEAARQSLEGNVDRLREALVEQGLDVESCMVEVRQGGEQAAEYERSDEGAGHGQPTRSQARELVSVGATDAGRRAFLRDRYFESESSVQYSA